MKIKDQFRLRVVLFDLLDMIDDKKLTPEEARKGFFAMLDEARQKEELSGTQSNRT